MIMHSQLDIRGVQREIGQHKIKRSMRLLLNVMAVLYNGLPHPKGGKLSMGTKCKPGANYGTHVRSSSTIHIMSLLKQQEGSVTQ